MYLYANANPVRYSDPNGLKPCPPGMVPAGVPCHMDEGDSKGSGDPNEGRCATAECAARLPPPSPPPSKKALCRFSCNVKPQIVCTASGIATAAATKNPLAGGAVGLSCIVVKAVVCEYVCDDDEKECKEND